MRKPDTYILAGGLNTEDAQIKLRPGEVRPGSTNFECVQGGGYRFVDGYERFDGRAAKPSATVYTNLPFTANGNTTPIAVGDALVGNTSTASSVVVNVQLLSGSWAGGDAAGILAIVAATLAYTAGEVIKVGGNARGLATTTNTVMRASDTYHKQFLRAAQGYYRNLIQKVPGQGAILGVVNITDATESLNRVYAFRKQSPGTAIECYLSTTSGWSKLALCPVWTFTNGSGSDVVEGTTLTQGANTATILSVSLTSGSFGAGTAAGYIGYTDGTPGALVAGAATTPGGGVTLGAGNYNGFGVDTGTMGFVTHNFTGDYRKRRIYGYGDWLNQPFEIRPILSPLADHSTPMFLNGSLGGFITGIAEHLERLWLCSSGGSIQYTPANLPYSWSVILGAGELALGEPATNIKSLRSDALAVTGLNTVRVLLGTTLGSSDFRTLLDTTGAAPRTLSEVNGAAIATDRIGTYFLEAAQEFGNFKKNALSRKVERLVAKRTADIKFALVCKNKSQYRIFFNDKTGITATFDGTKVIGWFPFTLKHQFTCGWVGEDENGDEVMYAGTDDGYVMQLDMGTSFDGETIPHTLALAFANQNSVMWDKQYYTMRPDVKSEGGPLSVDLHVQVDYGGTRGDTVSGTGIPAASSAYGVGVYGAAYYGAAVVGDAVYDLSENGFNISPVFTHVDDIDPPATFEANTIEFSVTRQRK